MDNDFYIIDHGDNAFFDYISDKIQDYDISLINNQDDLVLYLDLTRRLSWDIPSALPCNHLDLEIPMHRPAHDNYDKTNPLFHDWDFIDSHFKFIHHLDLTDSRINWSFDT